MQDYLMKRLKKVSTLNKKMIKTIRRVVNLFA